MDYTFCDILGSCFYGITQCDTRREAITVYYVKQTSSGKITTSLVWALAVTMLILSGVGYRLFASHLKLVVETPITLPVPLSSFPAEIGQWKGKDIPIPENIQRVAGNDDFLNRLYINKSNNEWANLYIAFTARPRTMSGHRPEVCYVGGGWIHDSTETSEFVSTSGRRVPCLVQRFHIPTSHREERVVLNFYILNGQLVSNERGFSGVGWRTPNIAGDPARYVTQVQISSVLENSVRKAAKGMTELILNFFPDKEGIVKAEVRDQRSEIRKR